MSIFRSVSGSHPTDLPADRHPRPSACAGLCPLIVITGFCPHCLQSLLKQHLLNEAYPDPSLSLQPLSLIILNSLLPCGLFLFHSYGRYRFPAYAVTHSSCSSSSPSLPTGRNLREHRPPWLDHSCTCVPRRVSDA